MPRSPLTLSISRGSSVDSSFQSARQRTRSTIYPNTECRQVLTQQDSSILTMQDTQTGQLIAGTHLGRIHIYDMENYTLLKDFDAHEGGILSSTITPKHLITTGTDALVKLWDLKDYKLQYILYAAPNSGDVLSVACHGSQVIFGCQNTSIQWFDFDEIEELSGLLSEAEISARDPRFFRLFPRPPPTRSRVPQYVIPHRNTIQWAHGGYVYAMRISENRLFTGGGDGALKVWNIDKAIIHERSIDVGAGVLVIEIEESNLFAGLQGGEFKVFDLDTFTCVRTVQAHSEDVLAFVAFGADYYTGSASGTIKRWNTHFEATQIMSDHQDSILALVKDSKFLISAGSDNVIRVWEPASLPGVLASPHIDRFGTCAILCNLNKFVRFQSISSDSAQKEECRKCAKWLKKLFFAKGAIDAKLVSNDVNCNPVVLAKFLASDWKHRPERPVETVLFYAHYDVQPARVEDGWDSHPFHTNGRDGYIYGRGVSDNKGPLLAFLEAVAQIKNTNDLCCNVSFIVDGDQESGNNNGLMEAAKAHKEYLGGPTVILASNSYWLTDNQPCLTYGLRGVINARITVNAPYDSRDFHSGWDGGAVVEPLGELVRVVGKLTERMTLDRKLHKNVRPVQDYEEKYVDRNVEAIMGLNKTTYYGGLATYDNIKNILYSRWRYPTLSLHHIEVTGSGRDSVISLGARAVISIRTVPDQKAENVVNHVRETLQSIFKETASNNKIELDVRGVSDWWLGDTSSKYYKAMEEAVSVTWREEPLHIREGGSIFAIPYLEQLFEAPAIHLPLGQASDAAHLPNERIAVKNLHKGHEIFVHFLKTVGRMGGDEEVK